jgi:hypothetical protein
MESGEVLNRFIRAYKQMGLTANKAASFAYKGVRPFGRSWGYFADRLLKEVEPLERKTDLLANAEPANYLTYQENMFCALITLGYAKGEAVKLCKFRLQGVKPAAFSKHLLDRSDMQYRLRALKGSAIFLDTPIVKPVNLNDVRAIERRLTIKQSVFCGLLAKGVTYKDAAKITGLGKTDASNQSAGCRLSKQVHIQMYVGHLIYEQIELQSLL